ncbi:MAG: tetratricopeptide repeat protein [Vicinamibacterales bacterium]
MASPATSRAIRRAAVLRDDARYIDAGLTLQAAWIALEQARQLTSLDAADVYHALADLEGAARNWLRGEPFAREALRLRNAALPASHPAVTRAQVLLAGLLVRQRKVDEAERLVTRALAAMDRRASVSNRDLADALEVLAEVRTRQRRHTLAEAQYLSAIGLRAAEARPDAARIAVTGLGLAAVYRATGRRAAAIEVQDNALAALRKTRGRRHPEVAHALLDLATTLRADGRRDAAATAKAEARRIIDTVNAVNPHGVAKTGTINPFAVNYRVETRESAIHHLGVFARQAIPAWRKVIEYTGERISKAESGRRWDPKRSYLFELTTRTHLDGAIGGSGAEYINHSCDPNIKTRILRGHILYYSQRPIRAGEELTVDYRYDHDSDRMSCYCGSPKCRGTMNLPKPTRRRRRARR